MILESVIPNCCQQEGFNEPNKIPNLTDSGYVFINDPKNIEIYKSYDSVPMKLCQWQAQAKVYKTCDQDRRSKFQKYVLLLVKCVVSGAVEGAVAGTVSGAFEGLTSGASSTTDISENILYEAE